MLALFGLRVPAHRSTELWEDQRLAHPDSVDARDLDLVLFNNSNEAWGAHVAVVMGDALLHLCAEEGRPAIWSWTDFSSRPRYAHTIGLVRATR
ncbi:hydrolase [Curtobacterium ammoniigenes]|uniref:hydrolase n=1 Tax=Curtobacterium ammoniigenes TaxID=395387 RepID=UPI0012EE992F|nr:hydrolase [Curtobacterium ammoniigenes]